MSITYNPQALRKKADEYCYANGTTVTTQLGFGLQGIVFKTERNTAIKVYALAKGYQRECEAYRRLNERGIYSVRGMTIPRIKNWDDILHVFEMSIVHVPCILDFGGAYVDSAPEHMNRDEVWFDEKAAEFGSNWDEAQAVIKEFEYRSGIWLSDVNNRNIKFSKQDEND